MRRRDDYYLGFAGIPYDEGAPHQQLVARGPNLSLVRQVVVAQQKVYLDPELPEHTSIFDSRYVTMTHREGGPKDGDVIFHPYKPPTVEVHSWGCVWHLATPSLVTISWLSSNHEELSDPTDIIWSWSEWEVVNDSYL